MGTVHQIIGNTVAEWDDIAPFAWTMSETTGPKHDRRSITKDFDLTKLRVGYEDAFLLGLKDLFVSRRKQIILSSIVTEFSTVRVLLNDIQDRRLLDGKVTQIDQPFLLALGTICSETPLAALYNLKHLYTLNRASPLFANDLLPEDFPQKKGKKGHLGEQISRILAKALNRAACVEILRRTEDAYEAGGIDIGHFAFLHLAFHVYCRPSSYWRLTLADLQIDKDPDTKVKTYFLWVLPPKTGVNSPNKIAYQLNRNVGELLEAQRIHVIKIWGHLIAEEDIGKLALFPAREMGADGRWRSQNANEHFGETTHSNFRSGYLAPILKLQESIKFNFNGLRHTVGTQLAAAGCSAVTIQAVLKHASDTTCSAYVDIAFHGLINELSDAMRPAFDDHFPAFDLFRSKDDPVQAEKAINSTDMAMERTELTGECGRQIACQYAPIACYACQRFKPCFDADHVVNLDVVEAEIAKFESAGLTYRHLLEMNKQARRHILLVMAAADQYRNALAARGGA